jgi:hypothetical protein
MAQSGITPVCKSPETQQRRNQALDMMINASCKVFYSILIKEGELDETFQAIISSNLGVENFSACRIFL